MLSVFGSINLDVSVRSARLPQAGETLLGGSALFSPGGKGANQAHAARRFGIATRMFGRVGSDAFATPALAGLTGAGVDLSGVEIAPDHATGVALINVGDNGENSIVVAPGANLAAHAGQVPDAALRDSRVLLLQLEVPLAQSLALARRARRLGCRVMLNASPLPEGLALASGEVDLLIVNRIELDQIAAACGITSAEAGKRAHGLVRECGTDVLVTLGADGARLVLRDGSILATPALAVTPVDTTGAGDTFAGVFGAAVASGEPLQRALNLASVAAGLACLRPGAQSAQPDRRQVEERMAQPGAEA